MVKGEPLWHTELTGIVKELIKTEQKLDDVQSKAEKFIQLVGQIPTITVVQMTNGIDTHHNIYNLNLESEKTQIFSTRFEPKINWGTGNFLYLIYTYNQSDQNLS